MSDPRWNPRRVLLAQCGDRRALEKLLAEIQETLMSIYKKLRWLREPELFRPWAYRIATRHAIKALRHERRFFAEPLDEATDVDGFATSPADAPDAGFTARIPELLDAVSPLSRAVLLMHYREQMTLGEVAAALGLPVGTVKSRLAYGLATIRRTL